MRWEIRNIAENIVNVILLIVTLFLGGRIIFELLAANPTTPFVAWVYSVSAYFMTPFQGIFSSISLTPNARLDVPALFSIIAYSILGFILVYLIRILTARFYTEEEIEEEHIHEHNPATTRDVHAHSH